MQLTLREFLNRLPRYLVMVNPSKIMGLSGDWQNLSAHETILEALRQCSCYMAEAKLELGIQLTSMEADPRIEPWIVVVDRVETRTVVWINDSRLHVADGALGESGPRVKPDEQTAPIPPHLLTQATSHGRSRNTAGEENGESGLLPFVPPLPSPG